MNIFCNIHQNYKSSPFFLNSFLECHEESTPIQGFNAPFVKNNKDNDSQFNNVSRIQCQH